MARADWTRQAEADLEAIYEFIARRDHRLSVAKNVVIKLRDHCENYAALIAEGHELGTVRNDFGLGIKNFSLSAVGDRFSSQRQRHGSITNL